MTELTEEELDSTRGLSKPVEVREEIHLDHNIDLSSDTMHCVINRKPTRHHCCACNITKWISGNTHTHTHCSVAQYITDCHSPGLYLT